VQLSKAEGSQGTQAGARSGRHHQPKRRQQRQTGQTSRLPSPVLLVQLQLTHALVLVVHVVDQRGARKRQDALPQALGHLGAQACRARAASKQAHDTNHNSRPHKHPQLLQAHKSFGQLQHAEPHGAARRRRLAAHLRYSARQTATTSRCTTPTAAGLREYRMCTCEHGRCRTGCCAALSRTQPPAGLLHSRSSNKMSHGWEHPPSNWLLSSRT